MHTSHRTRPANGSRSTRSLRKPSQRSATPITSWGPLRGRAAPRRSRQIWLLVWDRQPSAPRSRYESRARSVWVEEEEAQTCRRNKRRGRKPGPSRPKQELRNQAFCTYGTGRKDERTESTCAPVHMHTPARTGKGSFTMNRKPPDGDGEGDGGERGGRGGTR